jgi:hypothetical protein
VVYSGDQEPITSRRWEAFREGLQDIQYLDMLAKLVKQAEERSTVQGNNELHQLAIDGKAVHDQAVNEVLSKKEEQTLYSWREKIVNSILLLKEKIK